MTTALVKSGSGRGERALRALIDRRAAARLFEQAVALPAGWSPGGLSIARVYPAGGGRFGVQWAVKLRSARDRAVVAGSVYLTSGLVGGGANDREMQVRRRHPFRLVGLRRPVPGTDYVIHTPDQDDGLAGIVPATSGAAVRERLESGALARRLGTSAAWGCDCLNYRPRRRCVLRYRGGRAPSAPFVVAKVYRKGHALRAPALLRRVRRALAGRKDCALDVPHVLATWRDWNTVVFEGLAPSVESISSSAAALEAARAAGGVLATLHSLDPAGLPPFAPADELVATGRWVKLARDLERMTPRAERLWKLLRGWAGRLPPVGGRLIHRDFYDSQLIRTQRGWALVDFDTAAAGDPEQDVANFVGHLGWDALKRGRACEWPRSAAEFLEGYGREARGARGASDAGGLSADRVRFYLISALLRVGIIHGLRSDGRRRAAGLHVLAEQWSELSPSRLVAGLRDGSMSRGSGRSS